MQKDTCINFISIHFAPFISSSPLFPAHRLLFIADFFGLYTLGLLSLYPWVHLLPVVEAWAPLWLGGHVVGFMTFGGYLIATKADIMQRKVKPAA
jgi:hypothetical protein